jgi:simple sugar transport system substrate-binding protein
MTMSRSLRIASAVALTAVVAACSSTAATPTPAPATPAPTQAATPAPTTAPAGKTYTMKDLVVGFIQTGSESGWRAANTSSFKETAQQQGIKLKFVDSQNKIENQITAFNTYIQDPQVNVIVLAAVGTTGYDDVLKAAKAAGKVVVIEDRRIDADASLYYTYIGSDFDLEGQKAAKAMCDLLKGKAEANIIEIGGDQAASAAIDRHKGFAEGIPACTTTKMKVLDFQNAPGWDPVQGKAIMDAFAGIQSAQAAGIKVPQDMVFVGVDATANGFKYLIDGTLGADIECNPLLAPQVFDAALKGLNGDTSTPKWVPSQETQFFAAQGADALKAILATRKY